MAMTTAAALVKTLGETNLQSAAFTETLRGNLWQGYLNWAVHQDEAEALQGRADHTAGRR